MPDDEKDLRALLADHEERLQRIEGALDALTVVYAIPLSDPEEKR